MDDPRQNVDKTCIRALAEEAADVARDPGDLYEVSPDAPELDSDLVMLYYLAGFVDAGAAGRLLTSHLLSSLDHTETARFDADSLVEHRSRRPAMLFTTAPQASGAAPGTTPPLHRDAE